MLGGVLVSAALFLDFGGATADRCTGILAGAVVIALVGALDDRFDLPPAVKLAGQIVAARDPGARRASRSTNITLPFVGARRLRRRRAARSRVARARRGDERRQLLRRRRRAGRRRLRDQRGRRSRSSPSTSTATTPACSRRITAGAALGFLIHNFHPASVFMGDCGSNLLGLLLGVHRRRGRA